MRFRSNIEAPVAGWMRFHFTDVGDEIDIVASDVLNDPFYEFVTAIQAAFVNGGSHDVTIFEEPAESILSVERSGDRLVLSLREKKGKLVGRVGADFRKGCRAVARNLYRLNRDVGCDGFAREWKHELPRTRIEDLWARVKSER